MVAGGAAFHHPFVALSRDHKSVTWTPERRREYQREYQRAWRARNPEKARHIAAESKARNRDKANAQKRARRAADPAKAREEDRAYRARNPWRQHAQFSAEAYASMWAAQDGKCYLCGDELDPDRVRIDHDHSCCPRNASCPICRRGLVHHQCNIMIGQAMEDPTRLRRAADALEAAQLAVAQRRALAARECSTLF